MNLLILESTSIILYSGLFIYTWLRLSKSQPLHPVSAVIFGLAWFIHGYLAYWLIDGGQGQNLSLFNIFCMTTWIASSLVGWNWFKHQAYPLLLVSLPIAAISILEAALFKSESQLYLSGKVINLLHILTGITALSFLLMAAMQASLVLYLDRGLRKHPANIHRWLGSLESMERYLIQLLVIGFISMSISLGLVTFIPSDVFSQQALHKVVLTIASWVVLGMLMYGHFMRGWRGTFAAKLSLVGSILLLIGYFGTKLVVEFLIV
ncbi:cytochrome C assembly family protein [Aliikangiella sp. IMCC44632]